MIARFLAALPGELAHYVHDHQAVRLAEHVRLRDLAVAQTGQLRNQLESIADPAMRRLVTAQLARLKTVMPFGSSGTIRAHSALLNHIRDFAIDATTLAENLESALPSHRKPIKFRT